MGRNVFFLTIHSHIPVLRLTVSNSEDKNFIIRVCLKNSMKLRIVFEQFFLQSRIADLFDFPGDPHHLHGSHAVSGIIKAQLHFRIFTKLFVKPFCDPV